VEIPKATLLRKLQGSRKRVTPKNSWKRSVIKEVGTSWNEVRFPAADRQKWKELKTIYVLKIGTADCIIRYVRNYPTHLIITQNSTVRKLYYVFKFMQNGELTD
jgi:hypothetical protein